MDFAASCFLLKNLIHSNLHRTIFTFLYNTNKHIRHN